MADLTGLSVAMLSMVERDQRRLAPMRRVAVAKRLGVRIADLFPVESLDENELADLTTARFPPKPYAAALAKRRGRQ